MSTRTTLLVAAFLLSASPNAQDEASAAPDAELPSARSIIDRHVEATGFVAATKDKTSVRVSGSISIAAMGIDGVYDRWQAKPDKFLMDAELAGMGAQLAGFDGEVAWAVNPMAGAIVLEGEQGLQQIVRGRFDGITRPSDVYDSIETVRREEFEGTDCYKLALVMKPTEGMDAASTEAARSSVDYYSVETGFLVGNEVTRSSQQGPTRIVTVFSDHKEFGGQMLPAKAIQKMTGLEIEITIEKVEYDTATDDTFALPDEIRAQLEKKKAAQEDA